MSFEINPVVYSTLLLLLIGSLSLSIRIGLAKKDGKTLLTFALGILSNVLVFIFVSRGFISLIVFCITVAYFVRVILYPKRTIPRTAELHTPFEDDISQWDSDYPRPLMKRDSFLSLNGNWTITSKDLGSATVRVPFPPESRLGGINSDNSFRKPSATKEYTYKRAFQAPSLDPDEQLLLHFGAVDQVCSVKINGKAVASHEGGYLPFEVDITEALVSGENTIEVEVQDLMDHTYATGKQKVDRGGMWYTPISGIWQSVWLEKKPKDGFASLNIKTDINTFTLTVDGGKKEKTITITSPNGTVIELQFSGNSFTHKFDDPLNWSPDQPSLYTFILTDGTDSVQSYFALRQFEARKTARGYLFYLNNKPIFLNGLLDQGYFPDGIYLPGSPKGYEYDVKTMKELGFNLLRKHIKVEPEIFYYECDKQGMLVMQDMPNSGSYSFLIDTILPTARLLHSKDCIPVPARQHKQFIKDSKALIHHLYSHPCVIMYTIFNEGWGQHQTDECYEELKKEDPSRLFDSASGWFEPKKSDVVSRHIYFRKLAFPKKDLQQEGKPLFLTEFGGYACQIANHCFNLDDEYGYRKCPVPEILQKDLVSLYENEVLPAISLGLAGAILTQVSDVEDETNGLVTYDRQVVKVNVETMQALSRKLQGAIQLN